MFLFYGKGIVLCTFGIICFIIMDSYIFVAVIMLNTSLHMHIHT